ncbi:MAG: two-component sensor histidine kinase, partial [Spirochaetales bacterium]
FFSRKVGSGGTGLGLAMVRHILNQHGGQVSIESVFGTGSTIRVLIPVT